MAQKRNCFNFRITYTIVNSSKFFMRLSSKQLGNSNSKIVTIVYARVRVCNNKNVLSSS